MKHLQSLMPQSRSSAIPAVTPSAQNKADITLHNQLGSALLRAPPEVRNEICKLAVLSTYEEGPISFDNLGLIEAEHRLPWTHACKQLWAETRLLPFALCTFSFATGQDYACFVYLTSAEQRGAVASLHLELVCEDQEMGWATDILDEDDDEEEDEDIEYEDEDEAADDTGTDLGDIHLKSTFPKLQKVYVEVGFFEMGYFGRLNKSIVKRWIADFKQNNKGVALKIKTGSDSWADHWKA
ncbi:hypothetical protein E8E12_011415 [Didymella heteroderae]|uniref:Uncharacterized protein n=1 Tax=Didymella heteroderae TaxID=1769908 RepID=A0A9P4X0M5_9PLEO|nr:hypothetical protein E8E12_011415 [Didymella heteroderae]